MNIQEVGIKCTGCGLCSKCCPKKCINMETNEEGFIYPIIDSNKCINCSLCTKVCPALNDLVTVSKNDPIVYASKTTEENIFRNSSSGGIATLIAKKIIENNGIVYGCSLNDKLKTEHIRIDNINDLFKIQGSKYTQSNIINIYDALHNDLLNNKYVVFIGTPCQVAAIKQKEKNNENLLLIDLICHGVTNDKVFNSYINYCNQKNNFKTIYYKYRDKSSSVYERTETMFVQYNSGKTKKIVKQVIDSPFYYGYLNNNISRMCCYDCKYKNMNRIGDITLGDYWHVYEEFPNIKNDNGYSKVIINTKKGEKLFNSLTNLEKIQSNKKIYIDEKINHNFKLRDKFFEDFKKEGNDFKGWVILKPSNYYIRKAYSKLPFKIRKFLYSKLK